MMAGIPPAMRQKLMAMLLQQGGGGAQAAGGAPPVNPVPPPMGGTPGINRAAPSPYSQPSVPPGGPGGMGLGNRGPMQPRFRGGRDNSTPPGAGGMFGPGSTAPMNPPRPTGPIQGHPPSPPPNVGPQLPGPQVGPAIGAATTAGAVPPGGVTDRPPMGAAGIAAIDPSVFTEEQAGRNREGTQADWLQGGADIDTRGTHTRGKYGTYVAANPLSHGAKAYAMGKGMKERKRLTEEEKEGIKDLKGTRKKVGKAVLDSYGMADKLRKKGSVDDEFRGMFGVGAR